MAELPAGKTWLTMRCDSSSNVHWKAKVGADGTTTAHTCGLLGFLQSGWLGHFATKWPSLPHKNLGPGPLGRHPLPDPEE